jgi:hypothetical protein
MKLQIRGSGTAIELGRLTDAQYRYWTDKGGAALKQHLDRATSGCADPHAVTSDRASIAGPCP